VRVSSSGDLSSSGDPNLFSVGDPNLSPRPISTPPLPTGVTTGGASAGDGSGWVTDSGWLVPGDPTDLADMGVCSVGAGDGSSRIAMRPCGTRMGDCFVLGAVSAGVDAGDVASLSLCAMVGLSVDAGGDLGDRRGDLVAVFGL